jgi:hypothetical protein
MTRARLQRAGRPTQRLRPTLAAALVAALAAAAGPVRAAGAPESVVVGPFSAATEGSDAPADWKPLTFKKVPRPTRYSVVTEDGVRAVRADSEAAASGLVRRIRIDLARYPIVEWRWKVAHTLARSDARKKSGDDYAARLYITFEYDPDRVSLGRRARYRIGRLLFGDVPIAAINYIWDSRLPVDTVLDNAYTDVVKMIVIESGDAHAGAWVTERRNLFEDYRRAFGETPPAVNGVAIMSDTDDTGETVTAFYGDIVFHAAAE